MNENPVARAGTPVVTQTPTRERDRRRRGDIASAIVSRIRIVSCARSATRFACLAVAFLTSAAATADLVFTSRPPLDASVDQPYAYTMTAADDDDRRGPGPGLRFLALQQPSWLELDRDRLVGTPRESDVGEHRVRLLARRRGETATQDFTITVHPRAPAPPAPGPPPGAPATADLAASVTVSPNPVLVDAPHAWTVRASHVGGADVANVELSIRFDGPPSYRIENVADAACAPGTAAAITCRWSSLARGTSRAATLEGRAAEPGTISASVTVSILDQGVVDTVRANDRATAGLDVAETIPVRPIQTLAAPGARGVAVADFDGDGRDDLAVAATDAVLVFTNSPDDHGRPFGAAPTAVGAGAGGAGIAAAKLDADAGIDVVVARPNAASVVLFRTTDGFEAVELENFAGARTVAIGDVDGDSLPDVVLASDAATVVYRNLGGRVFAAPETVVATGGVALGAADLTGEGRAEIVVGAQGVDVYRRNGDGYVLAASAAAASASSVALADVDGDATADLAVGDRSEADRVFLTRSGASLAFSPAANLDPSETAGVLLADFDVDGRVDVATIGASGIHRVHRHDGAAPPGFAPLQQPFAGARNPLGSASGLFDFDTIPDVAVVIRDGVEIFVNVGQPLPPGAPRLVLNGDATVVLTVGDEYVDPGANAFDDVDGNLTDRIVVSNPVDTKTIGSYVVTYEVEDSSGNRTTATRTVEVQARAATGGGGGGAIGLDLLVLLLVPLAAGRQRLR